MTIQAEVRDGRSRLLADDIVQAQAALEAELKDEAALVERAAGGRFSDLRDLCGK